MEKMLVTLQKGENAGNQHVLIFPQCILPFPNQISIFHPYLFYRLQINAFNLDQSETLSFGKEFNPFPNTTF